MYDHTRTSGQFSYNRYISQENADGENENAEETADKPTSSAASRKRKVKAAPKVLRRPIICICKTPCRSIRNMLSCYFYPERTPVFLL